MGLFVGFIKARGLDDRGPPCARVVCDPAGRLKAFVA